VTVLDVVDKLNKKHQVTEVDVIYSGAVNPAEAANLATYRLAAPGKKNSFTAKSAAIIKLKAARYNSSTNTVALTPRTPFSVSKPVQVLVYGTGPTALQDAEGRDIDGDRTGTAGGNATAIIARKGVTINDRVSTQAGPNELPQRTALLDAVLALADLNTATIPFGPALRRKPRSGKVWF
jgi:hypothetical protein